MPRTTADLVAGICEVDPTVSLTPMIATASRLVDRCCLLDVTGAPLDYSLDELTDIETYVAAHLYCIRDPQTNAVTVSGVQEQTDTKVDLRLQVTKYGQQAMLLDLHGGLAALNNGLGKVEKKFPAVTGRRPKITWLGKSNP